MNSFFKIITKHRTLSFIIFAVLLISIYTGFLTRLNAPIWGIILLDIIAVFIAYIFPVSCANSLITTAISKMNNDCDPYPLLDETERQISLTKDGPQKQLLTVNKAAAMINTGEMQKTIDMLNELNIDKYAVQPVVKFIYYHNLACAYCEVKNKELARIWFDKAATIYNDIPDSKLKRSFDDTLRNAKTAMLILENDFEAALKLLSTGKPQSMISKVSRAMSYAIIYIKTNEYEKAKESLAFVISNGNKLYVVTEAKEMLSAIESKEEKHA